MLSTLLIAATLAAGSHAENCAAGDGAGDMTCVDRNGTCVAIDVDGHPTTPLKDPATVRRVEAIKHGEDVCFQVTQPVSTKLRVWARGGGRRPGFVGNIETVRVNLFALDDYDPEFDSRLDSLNGIDMKADGAPDGTWQLTAEKPLKAGEYLAIFRIFGVGNWDKQAVLLKLDPALAPAPADKTGAAAK